MIRFCYCTVSFGLVASLAGGSSMRGSAFSPVVSQRSVTRTTTLAFSRLWASREPQDGTHSYMEGHNYDDKFAEVEAMGGDPFFLIDESDDDDKNTESSTSTISSEMAGFAPSLDFMTGLAESSPGDINLSEKVSMYPDGNGPQRQQEVQIDVDTWDGWEIEDAHFDD
eukprot:scaffold167398_cov46-Attheya_sp.AAC.2